ncbi:mechanosensitive ion channel [Croceibacterium sp. TMG7-5b_MA50]|uniref:mechanosensitive ion channel family protein n=1 Tax=Croceibacterium sp. TMG7-5b_MA50 TaxID=3121290 RepID=UPI003221A502
MNYIAVLQERVLQMARGFVAILPNIGIALLILFLTWFLARFAVRIADRLTAHTHLRESLKQLVETLVRVGIWIAGIMIAATVVMPGLTPASLFAGVGIGAVAIGFAFQDIFENFLAGVLIMVREKMHIGDIIEVEGIRGRVERINLRETFIRQLTGELTLLPNSMLFKNPVRILTDQTLRRDELVVGVGYDADLKQAMDLIRSAFDGLEGIAPDKPIGIYAREFGASSIDLLVQWWTAAAPRDQRETRTDVLLAIKAKLDGAGIEIPFPYLTHTFKEPLPLRRAAVLPTDQ